MVSGNLLEGHKNQLYALFEVISVSTDQQNDWRILYKAALLELDPAKLPERIEQACKAILTHMEMTQPNSHNVEHQALIDAMANLRVLRREVVPATRKESESPAPTG